MRGWGCRGEEGRISSKGNKVDVKNLSNIWDPVPRESEHPCHHMVTDYLVTLTYRNHTKIGKVILKRIEIAERIKKLYIKNKKDS